MSPEPTQHADYVVAEAAKAAWYTPDEEGVESPSEYWWDCNKDIFTTGYEMGYRAALKAAPTDGRIAGGDDA